MTFAALKLRDVTEIERMFERSISLVTRRALPGVLVTEIHRMLKRLALRLEALSAKRLLNSGVADRAVVSYHAAVGAEVLPVVTSETTLTVKVADVIDVGLPVGFHFREKVGLIDLLDFGDRACD